MKNKIQIYVKGNTRLSYEYENEIRSCFTPNEDIEMQIGMHHSQKDIRERILFSPKQESFKDYPILIFITVSIVSATIQEETKKIINMLHDKVIKEIIPKETEINHTVNSKTLNIKDNNITVNNITVNNITYYDNVDEGINELYKK